MEEYNPRLRVRIITYVYIFRPELRGHNVEKDLTFLFTELETRTFRLCRSRGEVSKNAKFGPIGPPFGGQFRGKLEILTTHISSPKGSVSGDSRSRVVELKFRNWSVSGAP